MLVLDSDPSFADFLARAKEVKDKWFKKLDSSKNKEQRRKGDGEELQLEHERRSTDNLISLIMAPSATTPTEMPGSKQEKEVKKPEIEQASPSDHLQLYGGSAQNDRYKPKRPALAPESRLARDQGVRSDNSQYATSKPTVRAAQQSKPFPVKLHDFSTTSKAPLEKSPFVSDNRLGSTNSGLQREDIESDLHSHKHELSEPRAAQKLEMKENARSATGRVLSRRKARATNYRLQFRDSKAETKATWNSRRMMTQDRIADNIQKYNDPSGSSQGLNFILIATSVGQGHRPPGFDRDGISAANQAGSG